MTMLSNDSKILIVLTGSLGDVVRGMCLVSQLKAHSPNVKVSWVIDDKWQGVLGLHDQLDEIIVFERKKGLAGVVKLISELKDREFDITLDLQRHFKSGLISWFSGSKTRIGFNRKNCKELNFLFNNKQIDFYPDSLAKIQHYLNFVKYLGVDVVEPLRFGFESLEPQKEVPDVLSKIARPGIGIVLGSSWESKDWLPQGYYDLLLKLAAEYEQDLVLLGDPTQKLLSEELVERTTGKIELVNLVGETSLVELVSVIKALKLCIGPDSGPGHIAAAVGTPYVSLFGPTPPERVAPYGNEDLVVKTNLGCMPCYKKRCPGLNRLCMRLISAEQVMGAVRTIT